MRAMQSFMHCYTINVSHESEWSERCYTINESHECVWSERSYTMRLQLFLLLAKTARIMLYNAITIIPTIAVFALFAITAIVAITIIPTIVAITIIAIGGLRLINQTIAISLFSAITIIPTIAVIAQFVAFNETSHSIPSMQPSQIAASVPRTNSVVAMGLPNKS